MTEENSYLTNETPMHGQEVTLWWALWSSGVNGPHFLEYDGGQIETVNDEYYQRMINDYSWHEMKYIDMEEV